MKIDILLSTYNGEKYLKEQIDSLLNQSYQNFRIIIRDDGSCDGTLNILNDYVQRFPDKIIIINNNSKNLGSTNSFFELLHSSDSELIMFCDQDDVWNLKKLEVFVNYYEEEVLEKNKPVLIHSAVEVVDESLRPLSQQTDLFNNQKNGMNKSFCWQLFQNDVTGCTLMINSVMRDIINEIDFSCHYVIQHDWFLAQIAYLENSKYYISQKTIKYRQHSNNVIGTQSISFFKRVMVKFKKGTSYPFYEQAQTLLLGIKPTNNYYSTIEQFAALKSKNKFCRIIWHIKNKFYRDGNFLYKIYQLLSC